MTLTSNAHFTSLAQTVSLLLHLCYGTIMKKLFVLTQLCLLATLTCYAQASRLKDMIGRWEIGGEQNAGATLEIIDSTTIILTYGGETRKMKDIKIDFSKSPYWFDFSAEDTGSLKSVKSLVELGNDVMKWQLFIDEERTQHFTSRKGELLYLKRSRPVSVETAKTQ